MTFLLLSVVNKTSQLSVSPSEHKIAVDLYNNEKDIHHMILKLATVKSKTSQRGCHGKCQCHSGTVATVANANASICSVTVDDYCH